MHSISFLHMCDELTCSITHSLSWCLTSPQAQNNRVMWLWNETSGTKINISSFSWFSWVFCLRFGELTHVAIKTEKGKRFKYKSTVTVSNCTKHLVGPWLLRSSKESLNTLTCTAISLVSQLQRLFRTTTRTWLEGSEGWQHN